MSVKPPAYVSFHLLIVPQSLTLNTERVPSLAFYRAYTRIMAMKTDKQRTQKNEERCLALSRLLWQTMDPVVVVVVIPER